MTICPVYVLTFVSYTIKPCCAKSLMQAKYSYLACRKYDTLNWIYVGVQFFSCFVRYRA